MHSYQPRPAKELSLAENAIGDSGAQAGPLWKYHRRLLKRARFVKPCGL